MWQDIITSVATSTLLTGIWVFILNKAIENKFDMQLEAYKDKLKSESDKELLQLTKDLELKASEQNIKLTTLFQKQADVIAEVYTKLLPVLDAAEDFTKLLDDSDKQKKMDGIYVFNQKAKAFFEYYTTNKIYLPRETRDQINTLVGTIGRVVGYHYRSESLSRMQPLTEAGQVALDQMIKKGMELQDNISPLLEKLENDLQQILGLAKPAK